MAIKKPSDFFGKKVDENNLLEVRTDNTLREELDKVENLSNQVLQLQQELTQKVVKNDLESLVLSQINKMQENFKYLQNDITKSNRNDIDKFKEILFEITDVVNDVIENEIPKYKKQIINHEVRVSNQFEDFKVEVEERVQNFYQVLKEFNNSLQVIDTVSSIEKYIQEHHQELIELREEVFGEIENLPFGNLQENLNRLEKKIDYIRDTYSSVDSESVVREIIQEGLLNEPPQTNNEDPLTPLDRNFVTLEQLQEHYRLFINRIQQQLSTFGGGGETKLQYLDDVVGIATDPNSYDGKFLKYDHSLGKFVFDEVSGGGGSGDYANVAGIATYAITAGVSTYSSISGVSTYSNNSGIATYAHIAGIATYSQNAGVSTYSILSGISTSAGTATTATYLTDASNIITGTINKDRISTTNALTVLGDLYVSNNISFGGTTTQLNTEQLNIVDADIVLGIGTTFSPTDNTANHGGIAIASTEGTPLVNLNIVPGETNPSTYKKLMWFKGSSIGAGLTDAWLFNYGVGIGSTNVPNGVRLAVGNIQLTDNTVTATTFNGSLSGNATTAGYATTAGISTVSQGLTGTPNVVVGIVTATDTRISSVSEKTTLVNGNTVSLVYNTGGGNIAICTNPNGDIALNVIGIPTDSSFDNRSLTFSVVVNNTGTARSCTTVNLNGLSKTIRWFGGSLASAISGVTTSSGYDIYNFTGINTVGTASTTANYEILGTVNGGYR